MTFEQIGASILAKHKANISRIGDMFPHVTESGIFDRSRHCFWTGGFYAGLSHLCYEISKEPLFLEHAKVMSSHIADILYREGTGLGHDIGMLISPSATALYLCEKNEWGKEVTIHAADVLISRFHEKGEFIQAWNVNPNNPESFINAHRMIIDCMLNLPLLFRATEITGDEKYRDVALRHATTAQTYLVRKDGSTAHTFIFREDGSPHHQKTHQGYADDSCWSRGQGWAIMGFALAHTLSGRQDFLDTAILCANKYLELTEENGIPKWDFHFKGRRAAPRDTSAASISACGMMEIYHATGDEKWKKEAERIFMALSERYASFNCPEEEGMIREATGHMPIYDNINVSLIYGDYYYTELYARLAGISRGYW